MRHPRTSGRRRGFPAVVVAALLAGAACDGGGTPPPPDSAVSAPSVRGAPFGGGATMFDSVLATGALGGPPPVAPPLTATDSARALAARATDSAAVRRQ